MINCCASRPFLFVSTVLWLSISGISVSSLAQAPSAESRSISIPLTFEANRGQADPSAPFIARTGNGPVLLTEDGMILPMDERGGSAIRLQFQHARRAKVKGEFPTGGVANYYVTGDRKNWITGIPMFAQVRYRDIYPGIDAVFHGSGQQLEYDFEIKPGSSPDAVEMTVDGAEELRADEDGGLEIRSGKQVWRLPVPRAYQSNAEGVTHVKVGYLITGPNTFRVRTDPYDSSKTLVIDPVIEYSRVIGLSNSVTVASLGVDVQGNLIIAGSTFAQDFPAVNGLPGKFPSGSEQVFLTKLNPAGDTILFSTFIPASGFSSARGLAIDAQGNTYVAGFAGASDFPVTSSNLGSCTQFCNAGFVAKFNPAGALAYSTLLGSGQVLPRAITVDGNGSAYVTGNADFTLQTLNAFQPGCPTCSGAFFAKLDPAGANFVFASYFATPNGTGTVGKGIALDISGNILIAGDGSTPPLLNPWQINGGLYLAKFAPDGKTLLFSTQLGTGSESLAGMKMGPDGTVYLTGTAQNNDYPYAINAARHPEGPGGNLHIFATAINPTLTGFTYSTYVADGNITGLFLG